MTEEEIQNDECRRQSERGTILCLVRDLLFYSKIRAATQTAGMTLKSLRDPVKLAGETGAGLVADLNQPGVLEAAAAWRVRTGRPVVGFVSHVDTELIVAARNAGIDRILARSQFEKNLPEILESFGKSIRDLPAADQTL